MRIKICGITQRDQGVAIAQMGATALGFICVPSSPRYISPEQIGAIVDHLPPVDCIGVFADAEMETLKRTAAIAHLSGIQLHGSESPDFCQQLRMALPTVEIIKALRVKEPQTLADMGHYQNIYQNAIDTLLLDAYHPTLLGGTGQTLNWKTLQQFRSPYPWFLAGGLNPNNIDDALQHIRPDGIDVSSGVEKAPGDKDLVKVRHLLEQIAATTNTSSSVID